jgi:putative transposase
MPSTHLNLVVHAVWSTKDRTPFLTADVRQPLHDELARWLKIVKTTPLVIGGVDDHVHTLFGLKATHRVADVLEKAKKETSRWMHNEARVRTFGWQVGYGGFGVSASNVEAVAQYIRNQAEHHKTRTFQEEYVSLLKRHGVAYDPKYLW